MRLAQIRIVSGAVPRLARFYEQVLRTTAAGSDEYVELRTEGATLAISSQRAMELYGARAAAPGENRAVVLDVQVGDVDAERRRLHGVVAAFVLEPTDQPWGNCSMLFRDPDGNPINVYARIDDDD